MSTILEQQLNIIKEHLDENLKSGTGVIDELRGELAALRLLIKDMADHIENTSPDSSWWVDNLSGRVDEIFAVDCEKIMEKEYCCHCGETTGKAGIADDSNFLESGIGPFCDLCFEPHIQIEVLQAELEEAREDIKRLRGEADNE